MRQSTGRRGTAAVAAAITLSGACLAGCTGGTVAGKPAATVTAGAAAGSLTPRRTAPLGAVTRATVAAGPAAGQALIGSFIAKLRPGTATPFEVQYVTAGRTSRKIVYAVRPPGELMFRDTALVSGNGIQIVANGSGEYLCQSPGHTRWACQKLDQAGAAVQNKIFDAYSAAYWATFLRAFASAPGFARYHVSTFTTMTTLPRRASAGVAGPNCLDFSPLGTQGIDVVCVAAPGVLGMVTFHAISFIIESYDSSPPAALFRPPPGAKITKPGRG
jgi:hypothetical protein